jgi:ubiquinone/menaquinone biosynthesis C-methylase UbiE
MDAALQERVARERAAHTEDDVLARSYALKDRFAHIWSYPSRRRLMARIHDRTRDLRGQHVLDYGCGRGDAALDYLRAGARVTGIDISPVYVEAAAEAARAAGFSEDRFAFHAMDAHTLAFPDDAFDLVIGYGILHHLDPDVALAEIHRVLRPGGRVMLYEPLADHPLLRLFRRLTPKARTEDEAPFSGTALRAMTKGRRWQANLAYCGIVEAPVAMLTSVLMPRRPDNALLRAADAVERALHRRGWLASWNQYVLIDLQKPDAGT